MQSATERVRVGLPEIWAVLRVETRGYGSCPTSAHKLFSSGTSSTARRRGALTPWPRVSVIPSPGGYGAGGAHQYERLAEAMSLDRRAALRSASWGIGQVMGFHAQVSGFQTSR